ncbi:hypothetical protein JRQ81_011768 [Phrynocephalus forsythii]|uniref:Transposase n=1 Tax=Phrynocephalus forsythii TaxID=171643 RepID=A0A9Q0X6G2_9SAUR|nr:hypothetical protein JRQ81_011768 [Phrynocephalus forsythii]
MKAVYEDEGPSYDTVVRWKRNFQSGHMSLTDESWAGRPSIKDDLAMVKKVEAVILDDRRSAMERVMAEIGIRDQRNQQGVETSILSPSQEGEGPEICQEGDAVCFWDSRGVILTDYLQKGETLNSEYYCNLLEKLCDALKQKYHGTISKGIRLLEDNAPVHTAQASIVTAHRLGYELLQHPPYSPDLVPSDVFLFPERKKPLCGQRFDDREDVIFEVEQWFSSKSDDFYKEGLKQVKKRWQKCVTLQGDYVEKN